MGIFKNLNQCWSHANINRNRKTEIYLACVVSKLLYNLDSIWLLQADLQRINAFHVKCLRRIYRIPCSYISRISNLEVLSISRQTEMSTMITNRQIKLYQTIIDMPMDHPLRMLTCELDDDTPKLWCQRRRRGRPKQNWAHCVYANLQQYGAQ